MGVVFVAVAVHKHVFLSAVAVQITKEKKFSLSLHLLNQRLGVVNLWICFLVWFDPNPVQVYSS